MYGIFNYIWVVFLGQMLVNIPYMEHMGMGEGDPALFREKVRQDGAAETGGASGKMIGSGELRDIQILK